MGVEILSQNFTEWEEYNATFGSTLKKLDFELRNLQLFNDFYNKEEIEANIWPSLKKHPRDWSRKHFSLEPERVSFKVKH